MVTTRRNIAVVVAHPDDEVIGVGGTVLNHVRRGDSVSILILADGERSRDQATDADVEKRRKQVEEVARQLGVARVQLEDLPDNALDTVPMLDVVKRVEAFIGKVRPDTVYTHHYGDLNIDHRIAFEAVLTACRPQPGMGIGSILAFETLSSTEWQRQTPERVFQPNCYVDIADTIEAKLSILALYTDELRTWPHPRSIEGVRTLSQYRGMTVGVPYAEAFEVIRLIT